MSLGRTPLLGLGILALVAGAPACAKRVEGGSGGGAAAPARDGGRARPRAHTGPDAASARPTVPREPSSRVVGRVVVFTAAWCPSCADLDDQIFAGPAGRELLGGLPLEKVDFDAPASRPRVLAAAVTDLPTTVFYRTGGEELDRIVGFDGKEEFLAEAKAILAGRDGLHLLEDQLRRKPDDVTLLFKTGYKLLLRGREKEGQARYDRVLKLDPENRTGFASQVMMHRGRYLVRCKEDYRGAAALLAQAVARFGDSRDGTSLRYWHGWALCRAGRAAEAAAALDAWVEKRGRAADALSLAASLRRRCRHELPKALVLAREAAQKKPKDDWAWHLVADLAHAQGLKEEALEAIRRARALDPRSAFYRKEEARLSTAGTPRPASP